PRRRGRDRPRGGRVVPAADPRDPGRSPARRAARRHPALPHLLRGRVSRPPGAAAVIERIVVASDRSDTASRAVAWAAAMAGRYEAQLTIVQAFVPGPAPNGAETELAVYAEQIAGPGTRGRVGARAEPDKRTR